MHNATEPRTLPMGDRAIVVQFADLIDPSVNGQVYRLYSHLMAAQADLDVESKIEFAIPAYNSLTVGFDPDVIDGQSFVAWIEAEIAFANQTATLDDRVSTVVRVPVCYGGEFGPDVDRICQTKQISMAELVALHCAPVYNAYMLGFLPGFAYLGSVSLQLRLPRMETPRLKVAAGSVGIANEQTGVYPVDSPGGWNIIGRTPLPMIGDSSDQTFLISPGDRVQFYSIGEAEFERLAGQG